MIYSLNKKFKIILQIKSLQSSKKKESELQKQIKAHPYVIKLASQRARRFSVERLENIMNEITETDAKIKSGRMDKSIAFELLIYKMRSEERRVGKECRNQEWEGD